MVLHSFKNIHEFATTLSHVGLSVVVESKFNLMKGGVFND